MHSVSNTNALASFIEDAQGFDDEEDGFDEFGLLSLIE